MKKLSYLLFVALAAFACSSPKYAANFRTNHQYDQSAYIEKKVAAQAVKVDPRELTASTSDAPVVASVAPAVVAPEMVKKTYLQMNKQQRKEVRAEIKSQLKAQLKAKKTMGVQSAQATQGMDHDLKLAAIFGAVGVVALLIPGDVFYIIGGIALIIGVVFFVKWLVRQ